MKDGRSAYGVTQGEMAYQSLEATQQVKSYLIGHKGVGSCRGRHPSRAQDEDLTPAEEVGETAPWQKAASKGQHVGGHNPLLATGGYGQIPGDGGEDDDGALDGEGLRRVSDGTQDGHMQQTFRKLAPVKVATRAMERALVIGAGRSVVDTYSWAVVSGGRHARFVGTCRQGGMESNLPGPGPVPLRGHRCLLPSPWLVVDNSPCRGGVAHLLCTRKPRY